MEAIDLRERKGHGLDLHRRGRIETNGCGYF